MQNTQAPDLGDQVNLSLRKASYIAFRNFDEELNATFLTEDSFITTGMEVLLAGKEELKQFLASDTGEKM